MDEYNLLERSLLNASPETIIESKDDSCFHKVSVNDNTSNSPTNYADDLPRDQPHRRRERVAYRLDSIADRVWDTSANVLQLRTTGKGWTAEMCSCVFAILSLCGLVATLLIHENKPLPEWPQLITINSVVSLFSLLMRAGVGLVLAEGISQCKWQWFRRPRKLTDMERLEAASRSAWGSASLLIHTKLEGLSLIVALGAVVTILATLTGFFLQQLIVFQDCLQRDNSASVFLSKTNNCGVEYSGVIDFNYDTRPSMIAAINSAMVQSIPDYTSTVSRGCLSGNCTFPSAGGASFSTVAVGSACENITDQISVLPDRHFSGPKAYDLQVDNDRVIHACPHCDKPPIVMATAAGVSLYNDSKTLASVFILAPNNTNIFNQSKSEHIEWQAVKCSLFPTLNTYSVSIKNLRLKENLIDSTLIPSYHMGDTHRSTPFAEYERLVYSHRTISNRTIRNGRWTDCSNLTGFREDVIRTYVDLDTTGYYYKECIWSFNRAAAGGISLYFNELFDNQTLNWGQDSDETYWRNHSLANSPPSQRKGPPHLRQLYSFGNFSIDSARSLMEGVSEAMTTVIRTEYSDGPEMDLKGEMLSTTTCIKIDWRWLSFPAATISLTIAFLVLMMIETGGVERERLWKSSVLASLFCEVDHGIENNTHLYNKRAMYDIAKSTSVSLDGKKGTLRLIAR